MNWRPKEFNNWYETNFSSAEIERIETGFETDKFIELHQNPAKVEFRVRLPVKEYPQVCKKNNETKCLTLWLIWNYVWNCVWFSHLKIYLSSEWENGKFVELVHGSVLDSDMENKTYLFFYILSKRCK